MTNKKIKIPLSGFSNDCDMKLYNYGKHNAATVKNIKDKETSTTLDSLFENSSYKEALRFDRCRYDNSKTTHWIGSFQMGIKKAPIQLNTDNISVGREFEYFKLPNGKTIDLLKAFPGYGGNSFVSVHQDANEKRVVFSFESISNHNACGRCGASEGEKGYRIIYFDKNWNIKNKGEFLTESCMEDLYNTTIIKKTKALVKYAVKDYNEKLLYYLTIDKGNSIITQTK